MAEYQLCSMKTRRKRERRLKVGVSEFHITTATALVPALPPYADLSSETAQSDEDTGQRDPTMTVINLIQSNPIRLMGPISGSANGLGFDVGRSEIGWYLGPDDRGKEWWHCGGVLTDPLSIRLEADVRFPAACRTQGENTEALSASIMHLIHHRCQAEELWCQ
ncbi:unnamed protein product [Pleuronectes platessa]|uniref:Uncharacterized protein n=1 Tax=Pleuronectes platessa TaxID=8262 RepID=A0A9N7VZC6_PLEPL|nr:unnamed protein product [Pleuronectes platessa]